MPTPLTLVIDQGTYSTRALAFDSLGRVQAASQLPVKLRGHGSDEVEQDAAEILDSMRQMVANVLAEPQVRRAGVAAAGLTTQRSSVVAWHRETGQPLAPLLSWQDRRVAGWLAQFSPQAATVKQRTGLKLSPHYGAGKLRWYLEHVPAVARAHRAGTLSFGPLATFLIFHLLRDHPRKVDHANASRSQLWNLGSRDWDPWLLEMFGVPAEPLPVCCPILHRYGTLTTANIPLTAVNGDQNSAIFALGKPRRDTAIVNIGTGAFILLLTGGARIPHPNLLAGLASSSQTSAEYLLEGTVNGAGAALTYAAQRWHIADITQNLPRWLAGVGHPPVFLNSIGGLGSPWWAAGPEPQFIGRADEPALQAVAVVESILFLLHANLQAMLDAGQPVRQIQISGGLARLDGLCRRLANLCGLPVYRPIETEATARGIAWLAAGQPQKWPKPGRGRIFRPVPDSGLQERYHLFRQQIG